MFGHTYACSHTNIKHTCNTLCRHKHTYAHTDHTQRYKYIFVYMCIHSPTHVQKPQMYVHIIGYIYTSINSHSNMHIGKHIHIYAQILIHTCIYNHTYTYICKTPHIHTYTLGNVDTHVLCMGLFTYVPSKACVYTCIHIKVHIHIHMCTQKQPHMQTHGHI